MLMCGFRSFIRATPSTNSWRAGRRSAEARNVSASSKLGPAQAVSSAGLMDLLLRIGDALPCRGGGSLVCDGMRLARRR